MQETKLMLPNKQPNIAPVVNSLASRQCVNMMMNYTKASSKKKEKKFSVSHPNNTMWQCGIQTGITDEMRLANSETHVDVERYSVSGDTQKNDSEEWK